MAKKSKRTVSVEARGSESKKWMQGAVKRPGALTAKARAAGMSTQGFAQKHKHDPGLTGQQSRLALTFAKERNK